MVNIQTHGSLVGEYQGVSGLFSRGWCEKGGRDNTRTVEPNRSVTLKTRQRCQRSVAITKAQSGLIVSQRKNIVGGVEGRPRQRTHSRAQSFPKVRKNIVEVQNVGRDNARAVGAYRFPT